MAGNQAVARVVRMAPFLIGVMTLTACGTGLPPKRGPVPGTDVACLQTATRGDGNDFGQALRSCGVAKPDLTGNICLQRLALAAHVPFTIRPIADAELKNTDQVTQAGTLIPQRYAGQPYGF